MSEYHRMKLPKSEAEVLTYLKTEANKLARICRDSKARASFGRIMTLTIGEVRCKVVRFKGIPSPRWMLDGRDISDVELASKIAVSWNLSP